MIASLLTSLFGAIANLVYERFFDPTAYAAGPVLARFVFAFTVPFFFILAGLIFLGLPIAYVLRLFKLENWFSLAISGAGAGYLIGAAAASGLPHLQILFTLYGCGAVLAWWASQYLRI